MKNRKWEWLEMAGKPWFKLGSQEGCSGENLSQNQGVSLLQTWEPKKKKVKTKDLKKSIILDKIT